MEEEGRKKREAKEKKRKDREMGAKICPPPLFKWPELTESTPQKKNFFSFLLFFKKKKSS